MRPFFDSGAGRFPTSLLLRIESVDGSCPGIQFSCPALLAVLSVWSCLSNGCQTCGAYTGSEAVDDADPTIRRKLFRMESECNGAQISSPPRSPDSFIQRSTRHRDCRRFPLNLLSTAQPGDHQRSFRDRRVQLYGGVGRERRATAVCVELRTILPSEGFFDQFKRKCDWYSQEGREIYVPCGAVRLAEG